jgi:hypothetical protein
MGSPLALGSRLSLLVRGRAGFLSTQYSYVLVSRPTFISCPFVRFTVIRCGNFVSGSRAGGGITTRHFISRAAGESIRVPDPDGSIRTCYGESRPHLLLLRLRAW